MYRPTLIETYLSIANILSKRSPCLRLKVGCVITNFNMTNILSIGYNGNGKGLPNIPESDIPGEPVLFIVKSMH
jgi:deoxycytidylate deaminase